MLEAIFQWTSVSTILVAVTSGLLATWVVRRLRYKLPPGPMGLPFVGNILQCESKRLPKQMYEWSLKYGPVISLRIGPMLLVVANDVTTAMEVLVKKTTDFAGRVQTHSVDLMTNGGKDIIFSDYGTTWHVHRKVASKALRMYMQGANLDKMVQGAFNVTMTEMEKIEGAFDPAEYIDFLVCNILNGLCFGRVCDFNDQELRNVIKMENESFSNVDAPEDYIPWLKYVYKSKAIKFMEKAIDVIDVKYIRKYFDLEESTFDRNNIRHFTDFLLLARLQAEEEDGKASVENLTKAHLYQTCSDIFFAGIDTTRITLGFLLRDMIINPEIQENVFQEVNSVVGMDRMPNTSDRKNLPYTEAVLHESMRLHTVAPTAVPHKATCDTTVNGYDVPKGTIVMVNLWALHHRPDAWEHPEKFIPERFLDTDGKMGPKPPAWLPFSAGKRGCLGEFVAKPELHVLFAALVQRFKWKMVPDIENDLTDDGMFMIQYPKPYKVIVEKRVERN